jgi:ABC-type Fe3+-hydroxamate transport system substrate-binding protein
MEPTELSASHRRLRAEYRRRIHEEAARSKYKNAAEALEAFGDLFESDEEAEEFADYIQQIREEERARYRD